MFNRRLKERIAELETNNANLQEQYQLVYALVQQRQDDVVILKRELLNLRQQPQSKLPTDFYTGFKDKVEDVVNFNTEGLLIDRIVEDIAYQVADYLGKIIDSIFYPESDEDEDEDED